LLMLTSSDINNVFVIKRNQVGGLLSQKNVFSEAKLGTVTSAKDVDPPGC